MYTPFRSSSVDSSVFGLFGGDFGLKQKTKKKLLRKAASVTWRRIFRRQRKGHCSFMSVLVHRRGFLWTDFRMIWYRGFLTKICQGTRNFVTIRQYRPLNTKTKARIYYTCSPTRYTKCFNEWVYSSRMLARHVSDVIGPSSGAFFTSCMCRFGMWWYAYYSTRPAVTKL